MFIILHFSDLDPIQAPHWSVRVRKADNPQCLLGKLFNLPFLQRHQYAYPRSGTLNVLFMHLFHLSKKYFLFLLFYICDLFA